MEILTLQAYNRWRSLKVGQELSLENSFHLIVDECYIMTLILEPYPDVALELVKFRKYSNYRNLQNLSSQLHS